MRFINSLILIILFCLKFSFYCYSVCFYLDLTDSFWQSPKKEGLIWREWKTCQILTLQWIITKEVHFLSTEFSIQTRQNGWKRIGIPKTKIASRLELAVLLNEELFLLLFTSTEPKQNRIKKHFSWTYFVRFYFF